MPIRRNLKTYPDPPDKRDFLLAHLPISVPETPLPDETFNRQWVVRVYDQGEEGSCTANRTVAQWEWELNKFTGKKPNLSRAFVYAIERQLEGTPLSQDDGASPRSGCKCVTNYGICPEEMMPYDDKHYDKPPTSEDLQSALDYKGGAYHRLKNLDDALHCLASLPGFPGHPFSLGFDVPDVLSTSDVETSGLMPLPKPDYVSQGGHDTLVIDYSMKVQCPNAKPGAFLVQNSWGDDWGIDPSIGKRGFFWFPFDAVPLLVSDMWILHYGAPWKPTKIS